MKYNAYCSKWWKANIPLLLAWYKTPSGFKNNHQRKCRKQLGREILPVYMTQEGQGLAFPPALSDCFMTYSTLCLLGPEFLCPSDLGWQCWPHVSVLGMTDEEPQV